MKKVILLMLGVGAGFFSFAQKISGGHESRVLLPVAHPSFTGGSSARTTATGDTVTLSNTTSADTPTLYFAGTTTDSGFVSGTDAYGDMGYAERFDFGTADSSLNVIGVITFFGGTVNPASTKTVTFYTWNVAAPVSVSSTVYESGLPGIALDSVNVSIRNLGIAHVDTVSDTLKTFFFTSPTGYLSSSFFVGYTINYAYAGLSGDTIGLYTSTDGSRTSPLYTVSGADTFINNQNATLYNDGSGWHDDATDNFFLFNDYFIYPIAIVRESLGFKGITRNNLVFFGNYPNPATDGTTVQFNLNSGTDVTLQVMDMNGKVINSIEASHLPAGAHTLYIPAAGLSAGDYLYLLRTAQGDGIASKFTVVK